jgi:TonB family protein
MIERFLELQAAPTDVFQVFSEKTNVGFRVHSCPGFLYLLAADQNFARQNQSLCALSRTCESAFQQKLVEPDFQIASMSFVAVDIFQLNTKVPATKSVQGVEAPVIELVRRLLPCFSTVFSTEVLKSVRECSLIGWVDAKNRPQRVWPCRAITIPPRAIVLHGERHHLSSARYQKIMLGQTKTRKAGTAYQNDRSRMFLALVVLLFALAVLVVKDRDFWFGNADVATADQNAPEWNPNTVVQPPATPAAPAKKLVTVAAKSSTEPAALKQPTIATAQTATRPAVIPPLEVEVIAGDSRNTIHLGSNPVKIETRRESKSQADDSITAQEPTTAAAERVQLAKATVPRAESQYPLLGRQMKVQGAVLLKAMIGADGFIRDLRVLSGPAILASAAREAARRWQFKPYLQNGQPVETQANITVNFTIKVLDNGVRDMDTVVALSRGGE